MRVFLDANVIISVLNKEYPLYTYSSRILSLANSTSYSLYTSPLCLAIAFYFASKKSGQTMAKRKISILAANLKVTSIDGAIVKKALHNLSVHDFEDGLEYYSAVDGECQIILTENQEDFYFGKMEVLGCREFITNYF
ncbi:PIN domain-containing protein [Fulvivirga sp. M361]|uniref:PIN domain-containing protein n=1 Tax=Fulvivirga sp. M361 TaxID=2594266 RepID=UPI00117A54EF|nr:PIN domain-containing protein [Fulvivirga sp. M361]TRX61255.1 PIN domain-containing protein [Fulvivirga sp. M361]